MSGPAEIDALCAAILDRLLPGDGDWPAAGAHGLAPRMRALLEDKAALAAAEMRLGAGFLASSPAARDAALRAWETEAPETFEPLLVAAYNAYYTDPAIRDLIERLTGYENRPPQPLGYALEPFDETLLDKARARAPSWRRPDD